MSCPIRTLFGRSGASSYAQGECWNILLYPVQIAPWYDKMVVAGLKCANFNMEDACAPNVLVSGVRFLFALCWTFLVQCDSALLAFFFPAVTWLRCFVGRCATFGYVFGRNTPVGEIEPIAENRQKRILSKHLQRFRIIHIGICSIPLNSTTARFGWCVESCAVCGSCRAIRVAYFSGRLFAVKTEMKNIDERKMLIGSSSVRGCPLLGTANPKLSLTFLFRQSQIAGVW